MVLDQNTVVLVEGSYIVDENTSDCYDLSYFFNISFEEQLKRMLEREHKRKAETGIGKTDETITTRVKLNAYPSGLRNKALHLLRYQNLVDTIGDPQVSSVKTVSKYGIEITYADNNIASVNKIVGKDIEEIRRALVGIARELTDDEALQTLLDLVNKDKQFFDHIEKAELFADILEVSILNDNQETINALRHKVQIWRNLLENSEYLKGVDLIATDFDGVLKNRLKDKLEERFIKVIRSLMDSGLAHTTITGRFFKLVEEIFGPHWDWNRLNLSEKDRDLFWLIMQTGSVARSVTEDFDFKGVDGFTDRSMNKSEHKIAEKLEQLARESGLGEELDSGRARIDVSEHGLLLELEKLPMEIIDRHKNRIASTLKKEIHQIEGVPETIEITVSGGAVEVTPWSKGKALARTIRLRKSKRVVILADSVGTKENPGNDRSMMALTQKQIRKWEPDVDWDVELIKIYVGMESDKNVPPDCIISPRSDHNDLNVGPDSTYDIYDAINRSRAGEKSGGSVMFTTSYLDDMAIRLEKLGAEEEDINEIRQVLAGGLTDSQDQWFYSRLVRLTGSEDIRRRIDLPEQYYERVELTKDDSRLRRLINSVTPRISV